MFSRTSLVALLSVLTVGSTVVLTACAADSDDNASEPTDDEVKANALGALGAACGVKKCKTDLVCKPHSSGPPPGAMGLPRPPGSSSGGPPPGAMGMPNLNTGTCSTPEPGDENGMCSSSVHCHAGLHCEYPSSGPPPGAMGLPRPPGSSGGPPPGAVGLPMQPHGLCKPTSSGPPPGALGLPIHH